MQPPKKSLQQKAKDGPDPQELEKLREMAARAQADLQNAKDRMERESVEIRAFAMEALILKLLPTIDNFQRAFTHMPEDLADHEWVQGLMAMEQGLVKDLESVGLKKIESLGESADPHKHEVLQTGPGEAGKIIEVFEEGYELNGKVLRPAKVLVGNG